MEEMAAAIAKRKADNRVEMLAMEKAQKKKLAEAGKKRN